MNIFIGLCNLAFSNYLLILCLGFLTIMCAGVVIYSTGESQDICFMGRFSVYMLFTSWCLMVSNFSVCEMPFILGFSLF
jgi:NADH:ubiquinone oxidoreductase subunit 5 (subunit L)/multisubunit Na+/H+ antiporter MnhA subunit